MPGDGGFENDLVKGLNKTRTMESQFYAYRKKQHRFSSQDIDIVVDSDRTWYSAIECKSKQVDVDKTQKDNNETEDKIYFSQAFSKDKEGVSQVKRITEFLYKTSREGFLAIAYRRGRGRPVHYYAIHWDHVWKRFREGESGLPKSYVEEKGVLLMEADDAEDVERGTEAAFGKLWELEGLSDVDYREAVYDE